MGSSASPYEHSDAALKSLCRTLQKHDSHFSQVVLSERPQCTSTDRDRYLDSAVRVLSASTESIYNDSARWAVTAFEVKDSIGKVEQRIGRVEKRIDDVDERLSRVENQVEEIKGHVKEIKGQVEEIRAWADGRFRGLENRFTNMAAQHPWDDIVPVEYPISSGDRYKLANIHPNKVIKLWRLQGHRHQMTLVSLIKFYDIGGWESWGHEDQLLLDPDSSDEEEERNPDLTTAVRNYPAIALRALTNRLGINYERMSKTMLDWERDQKRISKHRAEKRRQGAFDRDAEHNEAQHTTPNKLRRTHAERASEEPSTRLPIKDLVGNSSSHRPTSSPESGTKLEWGSPEEPPRVFRDAKSVASGDSTIPFSE